MKKRLFLLALFALAVIGWQTSPSSSAQTASQSNTTPKRQLLSVTVRHVKPELMEEYLNFIKNRMNPLRIKGGAKQSLVWTVGRGPQNTVITASPVENYADQDQPAGIAKALDSDATAVFWQQHAKYLRQQESYLIESLPECSWTSPKFKAMPKMALLRWQKIAAESNTEFENYLKNVEIPARKKIADQSNMLGQWRYRIRHGGDSLTYLMMRPLENYAEMDNTKGLAQILGEAATQKIYSQQPKGMLVNDEVWILHFRPDLSITPQATTAEKK